MPSNTDCFTGQSPGNGPNASHSKKTGGSRMCIGDGQVQAGLLNRGMGICCSGAVNSLMEGALPSVLWQPERFRSKREAAKACMAACVSMALHRWIRALVREWGLAGFGVGQETENVAASSLQRPPASIPKTTKRHRRSRRSSG